MGDTASVSATPQPSGDRLDSWKEIAAYLKRDVTTVQRWEKREGMPVHRHQHDRMGSVYAYRSELDRWSRSRNPQLDPDDDLPAETQAHAVPIAPHRKYLIIIGLLLLAAFTGGFAWLRQVEYFWKNPLDAAHFQAITDFDGVQDTAAISRDGKFVAFLSNQSGKTDVWLTQIGSGQFHNLTGGTVPELVNPSVRTLGFSPDGSLVTFWRKETSSRKGEIGVWAIPTLGGEPRPYLEGVAEFDWSRDGSRIAYHTPGPGDPLFIADGNRHLEGDRLLFEAPAGLHSHFPVWSADGHYIYFVHGMLPDRLDIWRIASVGGKPERITFQNARVSYPVLLNARTLLYLADQGDGSGPSLYSIDVERRIPHRLTSGIERYTSLSASADVRRLVLTATTPRKTLWRLKLDSSLSRASEPMPISISTSTGFSPRLGPDYLMYVSSTGSSESIWKLVNGHSTELWNGKGARVFGGPSISPDGRRIAFSTEQKGKTLLYTMQVDGTDARIVSDSLRLEGSPTWAPDGQSLTSAVNENGVPHLFRIPLDGKAPHALINEYSTDPAWSPDGSFLLYSGPDIGTAFSLKGATAAGSPYHLPTISLARGSRHIRFLPQRNALILLRGEIQHKDLWLVDLADGSEKQLTEVPPDFEIRDFDLSPDGQEIVLERVQERSDIVLVDFPR